MLYIHIYKYYVFNFEIVPVMLFAGVLSQCSQCVPGISGDIRSNSGRSGLTRPGLTESAIKYVFLMKFQQEMRNNEKC